MDKKAKHLYEFGPFTMDPEERALKRDGIPIELQHKLFDLLVYMVRNPNRLLKKKELQDEFWPEITLNTESLLTNYITLLRGKLGDSGRVLIKNEPKEGYRFAAEVRDLTHVPDEACPWVGLPPVDQSHDQYFCGREEEIQTLVERLETNQFLTVIGGSGLGKSSLIRAGLVPALERKAGATGLRWKCRVFEPSASPLTKLASELIELTGEIPAKKDVDSLASILSAGPEAMRDYVTEHLKEGTPVLLVVDQFENFLRRYDNTPEQNAFVENLLIALSDAESGIRVVLVTRTDFYHLLEQFAELWDQVTTNHNQYTVKRLSNEGLRRAIEEPARIAGLECNAAMVDAIVKDLHEEPGALSMLSQTMVELFQRREGLRLTYEAYQAIGGVQQTIENKAEEVFAGFNEAEQDQIRHIIISLTHVAELPENDLKGRADLDALVEDLGDYDQVRGVIDRLADERLLVTSSDHETSSVHEGMPRIWVEVSHDALIRYWPRARIWLNEKRSAKLMFDNLDAAVREWEKGRDSANLFRGSKLEAFSDAQSTFIEFRKPIHSEFLEASRKLQDEERLAESQRRGANEQRRKWRKIATVAVIGGLIFAVVSIVVLSKKREATRQRDLANSLRWAASSSSQLQSDPELSLLLAIEAARLTPSRESATALRRALAALRLRAVYTGHRAQVISVALSPDGKYLLTGGADNEARMWDLATGKTIQLFVGHTDWVNSADFSPNGERIVTASRDASVRIWDSRTGQLIKELRGHDNYLLKNIYLLPIDAKQLEMLGQAELARYRGLESMLPDPSLADPNPARAKVIPKDQSDFLKAYESRETEMIGFLKENHLVTLPSYLGRFEIRQLPEAFKPTSPGGFMNAPGVYDKDASGFYFIPTYNPQSKNFYIRAAIEDPRPILGHEGIPGHFLQLSIANHLTDEIRRQHSDNIMIEGWALYGEEMLMRTGLYPMNSASQGQVLRLARYRAARIGVDVNLHTGKWTFEQAVKYFMEAGGLDREAAEGEAAGAAASPTQKITYMTGKWQIMRLLGKYRDKAGKDFRLGQFHDDLIKNGSLPLSIVEWILLDDRSSLDQALK